MADCDDAMSVSSACDGDDIVRVTPQRSPFVHKFISSISLDVFEFPEQLTSDCLSLSSKGDSVTIHPDAEEDVLPSLKLLLTGEVVLLLSREAKEISDGGPRSGSGGGVSFCLA
ncbi:hypothetical protein Pcinc_005360 [Petrolisthes cinctipes]|uniref:Uncharacterized protein n=1 Tax=Petrolisthes cinctipes TaxID=88211 RepID=A0AAE1L2T6_PETCI|nr:hypothetical protein Pcinc_005360 [Petrolisthes cinctipes]